MMKKSWVVTAAGIMAALGGVPVLVAASGATIPAWWAHLVFPCVLLGILGTALMGWAAKGEDEHSTPQQVAQAGQVQAIETAKDAGIAVPPKP